MRQEVNYIDIPDSLFIEAHKVRDIVKARPLNKREKEQAGRGTPDIRIDPIIGTSYLITREMLVNNFRYTNGKKIKTSGWSSDKQYVVYRNNQEVVRVMQVPLSNTVKINGTMANEKNRRLGDYIVCPINSDGTPNRNEASIVSAAIFKKMCYIPEQDVIVNHRGSHNRLFNLGAAIQNRLNRQSSKVTNNFDNIMQRPNSNTINNKIAMGGGFSGVNRNMASQNSVTPRVNNAETKTELPPAYNNRNNYQYQIISQIHNNFGKRIGFVIQAINGETKEISKDTAIKLALGKKLANVEVVTTSSGEKFLRGNSIKLDDLPIIYK